jgi:small subunit ribosomal protein S6
MGRILFAKEVLRLKEYEVMTIIDPTMEDDKIEAAVTKIEGTIVKNGGKLGKTDRWGKKKLAYPIKKQTMGYYAVIYFQSPEQNIKEMDRLMRISDEVLRHMFVAKD